MKASGTGVGVGVEAAATLRADGFHAMQVPRRVHPLEVDAFGWKGLECRNCVAEVGAANAFEHRLEALRALGMARPGKMFEVGRMGSEQHGHDARRYLREAVSELPFGPWSQRCNP